MLLEPIVQHTDNFPFLSKLIHNIKQTKDAQDEGDEELNKVCGNITLVYAIRMQSYLSCIK